MSLFRIYSNGNAVAAFVSDIVLVVLRFLRDRNRIDLDIRCPS